MGSERYLIFKIFPGAGGKVREFRVSKTALKLGAIFLLLILSLGTYLGISLYRAGSERIRFAGLQKENYRLKKELEVIKAELAALKDTLENLGQLSAALHTMVGLEAPPPEFKTMGVGGYLEKRDGSLEGELDYIHLEIDKLLGLSKFERENFDQLQKRLLSSRRRLQHTPSIMPTTGYFTSGFGYRRDPFTGRIKFHRGIDLSAPVGTPVIAPADGIVRKVGRDRGFGLYMVVDHGYGIQTYYAHLHKVAVRPGRRVKRGQIIAYVGNTGRSTGPHLHYEVRVNGRAVNPFKYIIPREAYYD